MGKFTSVMNGQPQYMFDAMGNKIGVFLPMDEWEAIQNGQSVHVPDWEKDLIRQGLEEYHQNKDRMIDWETIRAEMEAEDGPL